MTIFIVKRSRLAWFWTERHVLVPNVRNPNVCKPNSKKFGFRCRSKSERSDFGRWLYLILFHTAFLTSKLYYFIKCKNLKWILLPNILTYFLLLSIFCHLSFEQHNNCNILFTTIKTKTQVVLATILKPFLNWSRFLIKMQASFWNVRISGSCLNV